MRNIMKGDFFKLKMFVLALAVCVSATAFAQTNVKISGVVLSDTNEPLIGVTVVQRGTSNGATTDLDGAYSLVVPENAVLEASYLGYTTEAMPVQSGVFVYNFTLKEDDKWLEEVVVIGYGIQKKKLITGATIQVKGENIEKLNTVDVLGALQSQSPGVYITQSSGQVGEGYRINIRGLGTTGETTPLYVIDGVAGGSLSSLNPSDIESIDVLKDAASAAIYGARAANGVILVTTKKGKAGKLQITYDGYYGVQNAITNGVTPLNAEQYMEIINKALLTQDSSGGLKKGPTQTRPSPATLLTSWEGTNNHVSPWVSLT